MPDCSTQLAGLELKNPVICGAGEVTMTPGQLRAMVDAGAAAVVAKSTNESAAARAQLRSAEYAALDPRWMPASDPAAAGVSLLNRSGLVDVPFEEWVEILAAADAYAAERDSYVIASLIPADLERACQMATAIEDAGIRCLELNIGAPHGREAPAGSIETIDDAGRAAEVVGRVRRAVGMPLLVKLTADGTDPLPIARAAQEAGADGLVIAGRQLGFLPDPRSRRPLLGSFAAIGGGWALPVTLRWIAKARAELGLDVSLVATNGVRSGEDVVRCLLSGACAVEVYTAVHHEGQAGLVRIVTELERFAQSEGIERLADLVGEAADARLSYAQVAAMNGDE